MAKNIEGRYYSRIFTSGSDAGSDLMTQVKSDLGISPIVAKKLTYIATGSYMININNSGSYSRLRQDTDGYWKLSLGAWDCAVSSFKIGDSSASGIYLEIIY
jgi:hypothetical protein